MLKLCYAFAANAQEARPLAHRLLAQAWQAATGSPLPPVSIAPNGKPYVPDGLHFSLTHSRRFAACLLSDRPVGLDAEWLRPVSPRLPQRLLDAHEQQWAASQPHGFLRLWTLREAYLKYTGEGLQGFGSRVHFRMDGETATLPHTACHFRTLLLPEVVLSLCTETAEPIEE